MPIDPFQAEVAQIALEAAVEHGFALAGGNALIAHGVVERETEDVDLFSPEPGGPGAVAQVVLDALVRAGFDGEMIRPPEDHQGEFARLEVSRGDETMHVDLARDWRQWPPVQLDVGPVVHIDDAVSSKVTAMVGRRVPRDFIDIGAAIAHGYTRAELMRLAFTRDPGLRVVDFTVAVRRLDQFSMADFAEYGLDETAFDALRRRFADWPREDAGDHEGHAVHAEVAEAERRTKKVGPETNTATLAGQAYPIARTTPDAGPAAPGRQPPRPGDGPSSRQAPEGRDPRRSP